MADNKSREENILYRCMYCAKHRVIKNGVDGSTCNHCDGPLDPLGFTNLTISNDYKKTVNVGGFHVDIDCSDALKGLKAVQREARKATSALRELEKQQKKVSSLPSGTLRTKESFDNAFDEVRQVCECNE